MNPLAPLASLVRSLKRGLGQPIATPETDPQRWLGVLMSMPNPDPILRHMGKAEVVYASIGMDPHVLGDLRSIRGNYRSYAYRVKEGDEGDAKSAAAKELCERWLRRCQPNAMVDWLEVFWQMSLAFGYGYRAHEVVWQLQEGKYLPGMVIDRPGRRFTFDAHGQPLLISAGRLQGEPVRDPWTFVISRHMPTAVNPYGVAVFSSCFWTWTFKTGGWRYFVKYCERHGLPWPVARYPIGTTDEDQDRLEEAVAGMIDNAYLVAQEGTGVELLTPSGSGAGALPQQNLIDLANREMSKALTGQAMVAELQGAGARAASETAMKRQESIDDSVRDIAAQSMDTIFRWITLFNFGDGVAPPELEFYRPEKAGKDRAEVYDLATKMGARPSRSAFLEEVGIPEAENDADALVPPVPKPAPGAPGQGLPGEGTPPGAAAGEAGRISTQPGGTGGEEDARAAQLHRLATVPGFSFAKAAGMTEDEAIELASQAADQALEDSYIVPVALMLERYEREGKTLAQFSADLGAIVGPLNDENLREVLERALRYATLRGAVTNTP